MKSLEPGQRPVWTGDDLSEGDYAQIVSLLQDKREFRLENYKDLCIRRRIAKRLRAVGAADIAEYLNRLRVDEDELDALLATLSIHVSRFFRNPDTYQILEREVLPELCRHVRAAGRDVLRLWSVGCAAGEEAYSLALLIDDLNPPGLQVDILGTDVSGPVLAAARQGLYDRSRLAEVPDAVRRKYFRDDAGRFRLIDEIRSRVRFERHNVMTEAPFPPADLILCRNVLIYFSRAEQTRVLANISEALSANGVLVLGRSEVLVGAMRARFHAEFPTERIYRRIRSTA